MVPMPRFIGSLGYTPSADSARAYIAAMKERYPDARHHCCAFAIGHGACVTHGMSDDGEPWQADQFLLF